MRTGLLPDPLPEQIGRESNLLLAIFVGDSQHHVVLHESVEHGLEVGNIDFGSQLC